MSIQNTDNLQGTISMSGNSWTDEDDNRIMTSGTKSIFIPSGHGGIGKPYDLAFDSTGNLFVSSEGEEEIYRFTSTGVPYRFSGDSSSALFSDEDLDSPRGIIITPDDKLLVVNEQDDNIVQFNPYDGSPTYMPKPIVFASGNGLVAPYDIMIGPAIVPNNSPTIGLDPSRVGPVVYIHFWNNSGGNPSW